MISPKEVSITWGSSPEHWQWISIPESRYLFLFHCNLSFFCWWCCEDGKIKNMIAMQVWKNSWANRCMLVWDSWRDAHSLPISRNSLLGLHRVQDKERMSWIGRFAGRCWSWVSWTRVSSKVDILCWASWSWSKERCNEARGEGRWVDGSWTWSVLQWFLLWWYLAKCW